MNWQDMPKAEFEKGQAIYTNKPERYYWSLEGFLEMHVDNVDEPEATYESYEPEIAIWCDAVVDADTIFGAIQEMLPAEEFGADGIGDMAVCKAAAEAANTVLKEAGLGAFFPSGVALFVPQETLAAAWARAGTDQNEEDA